jgi:peptide/nickel transport system ATP-binding protein
MTRPVLQIRGLTVDYITSTGSVRAVDQANLEVMPGEILGLAGESGSGKSTLMHAALRTLGPPAVIRGGEVWLEGVDLLSLSPAQLTARRWRRSAIVFQSAMQSLNPVMTLGQQFADVLKHHEGLDRTESNKRTDGLLERVGIDIRYRERYPHELSGGMRQRVGIALALALEPPFLVMDEPTTALDVVVQKEILQDLLAQRDALGFAMVFITHDLPLLLDLSERLAIMLNGRIIEVGTSESIRNAPAEPYTRRLLDAFPRLDDPIHGAPGNPMTSNKEEP